MQLSRSPLSIVKQPFKIKREFAIKEAEVALKSTVLLREEVDDGEPDIVNAPLSYFESLD
jgi:hypothetical protein